MYDLGEFRGELAEGSFCCASCEVGFCFLGQEVRVEGYQFGHGLGTDEEEEDVGSEAGKVLEGVGGAFWEGGGCLLWCIGECASAGGLLCGGHLAKLLKFCLGSR